MKKIQILGTGCSKCHTLAANAEAAAKAVGVEYDLINVTDINEIIGFGVMATPALAIDGKVKATGRVLSAEQIKAFLVEA